MNIHYYFAIGLWGSGSLLTVQARDYVEEFPIFFVSDGPYSYSNMDKKDYTGVKLNIITLSPPVMGGPTQLHAAQFSELTGAEMNVVTVPLSELFQKVMTPFFTGTPTWDAIIFPPNWAGDIMAPGYLATVPKEMLASPQWQETLPIYRHLTLWGGKTYGIPIDGDKHFLSYRLDAIDNADYQAKFQDKYGYPLQTPQTWSEYRDVAEFFNGWDWDGDGKVEYGSIEMTEPNAQLFWQFVVRAAPYVKHPAVTGGFFFDVEDMTPLINTPGWVRALEDMIQIQAFYPPDGRKFTLADVIYSFGEGEGALQVNWDDGFIQAMGEKSPIRNKVSAALAPGAKQVWNRNTQQWDEFPEINRAPFIAWGGWIMGVPADSPNQQAAFDFLGFMSNPENQAYDLTIGSYGVNPYREADFAPEFWVKYAGFDEKVAKEYTQTLQETLNHPNRVFDLRIPANQLYVNALSTAVSQALTRKATPQQALDRAAKEWDRITLRVGLEQQKQAYRELVKLQERK
ncbi:extracellular solute-binding protein [Thioflexithrix psekupsensis]|uniref:extracellular solute-binding protein n=1 Tax=Thioflexithrix psekupsensis TaxID=1570016 RepID=UPI00159408DA|nr:extracellular solute-binding protein [Thioflexithrix psekupsensis]